MVVVRFADNFVVGFEHREDAVRFLAELRARFARFGLSLHPDKTRLIEVGRCAVSNPRERGAGTPETFNVLGFTHACSHTRTGPFTVWRQTVRQRLQAKLRAVQTELRRRLHVPLPAPGAYLRSVVVGHTRYYGVPRNLRASLRSTTRSCDCGASRSCAAARTGPYRAHACAAWRRAGSLGPASVIRTPTSAWRL